MRVMVIEDDRKVASFIQTGLQQEGYAVDVLHEGSGAGEQARTVDYDCGRARPDAAGPIGLPGAARHPCRARRSCRC